MVLVYNTSTLLYYAGHSEFCTWDIKRHSVAAALAFCRVGKFKLLSLKIDSICPSWRLIVIETSLCNMLNCFWQVWGGLGLGQALMDRASRASSNQSWAPFSLFTFRRANTWTVIFFAKDKTKTWEMLTRTGLLVSIERFITLPANCWWELVIVVLIWTFLCHTWRLTTEGTAG